MQFCIISINLTFETVGIKVNSNMENSAKKKTTYYLKLKCLYAGSSMRHFILKKKIIEK